ncbi:endonuclease [Winogradskyella ouciana]|uniref:T9SS type A sorting domain-containing protein n=1 Tax=Winogradskyella ouciana TaxID=2608631 RepID=A0A7K1GG11_9FLAO|nr:endonuclease [Winogradskyella ouciana]MTE28257.1 T9SS type A sorting domain-containing protein [Winogradskyella ouciana]
MKRFFLLSLLLLSLMGWSQVLVINELDPDSPSTDDKEFIELKSQTPNFSTDGYILVFFNGSSSGGDSSYMVIDLNGYTTDNNGLLVIGSEGVSPFPQVLIAENVIQNGADAVGIYQASVNDFPEGTLATQTNLIDALVYDTNDADDNDLMMLLGETMQYNDNGTNANPRSIQRFVDGMGMETYSTATPTPRRENDGSGIPINPVAISVEQTQYDEGASFDITFTSETNVTSDLDFTISLNNFGFNTSDYTGNINLTIPNGGNSSSTTINLIDDADDEGDEVIQIQFVDLVEPIVASNNFVEVRVVDNDFTMAAWGTPVNPTTGIVQSTQPEGYYDSLDGLADAALRQALQDIIADPTTVRAQTYADVIDILLEADQNPENSNQVWLLYTEEGRAKLDLQTSSSNAGKWNREHTFPRSRGGFFDIEEDEIADGIDVFWTTEADSLRHGNSDAHALRAADAAENSTRGNQHYGEYVGPSGTLGSFRGDVARSVLYMEIRYNGLEVVNGFPNTTGQLGDLATLLDWHRNDPPDDFEMNRNNIVFNWQKNRNPFIDQPLLVEYIWGTNVGDTWDQSLSIDDNERSKISVYPNPTNGRLYISGLHNVDRVEVFSVEGKRLMYFNTVTNYIDIDIASGLYLVKLISNNRSVIKKVIKE